MSTKQEILELLQHTGQERIFSFIAEYATEDRRFYEKIKEALLPDPDDEEEEFDMDYYRELAGDCFEFSKPLGRSRGYDYYDFHEGAYHAAFELNKLLDEAHGYSEHRTYFTASGMAMAVVEMIPQNTENVDDSDGELSDTFNKAIQFLCDIVNNPSVAAPVKKEIYDWSKGEVDKAAYSEYGFDEIQTIYELCCAQLGDTETVLADMDREIMKATNEYRKSKAVLRKIRFMQSRNLEIRDICQTYMDINDVRKMWFNHLKEAGTYDEALSVAKQGIEIAEGQGNNMTDWKKSLFDVYLLQGDTANLLQLAEYLLLHTRWGNHRDEFYRALKEYTPASNWSDTVERLLAAVEQKRDFDPFVARIMHEHQLWQRLFDYCQKGSIYEIEKYENDLKPYFEKNLLELYHDYVEKQASITDARAYDEVARMLKRMRTFAGGNELVTQLLEKYRTIYKRRRNMMEVLKGV